VQPAAIPHEIPLSETAEIASAPGGVHNGVPDGVPHGVRDGVPGGDRFGVPGGIEDGDAAGGGEVHRVHGDVAKPEVLARVEPVYTEPARRARIQGVVIVETVIDTQGRVTDARVLKSLPMGLSESAVDAVRQWRFKPATLDGRAVSVYFTLTVKFELQ
jgi:protein TonB